MIHRLSLIVCSVFCLINSFAQPVANPSSSEILLRLKKLKVLGSVLYIAAHPDDENTRLLAYLSKDQLLRTGYLSLTRGDGGQNLIGNEQGVNLGLIRTQELLAARRIDGAEQYFTTAFDFGFSKNAEETFRIWNHDKILDDVVWVIRKFRPDVIIARFPGDERAGHGHHTASGILAKEAFTAAADPNKFPAHLKKGVKTWQAKRVLWNTFNFGNNNTIRSDQFKIDVGAYNPLLGSSIGELSAHSRSQHKSQGFGVPSSRGEALEYFENLGGEAPVESLMDGVDISWLRTGNKEVELLIQSIIDQFNVQDPSASVNELLSLLNKMKQDVAEFINGNPKATEQAMLYYDKIREVQDLITDCMGLYFEAVANQQLAVSGDSITISFNLVNRSKIPVKGLSVRYNDSTYKLGDSAAYNQAITLRVRSAVKKKPMDDQPYWLREAMNEGSYAVTNQNMIGVPENNVDDVRLSLSINRIHLNYYHPLRFKFTDPVKGEIYQPVIIVPAIVTTIQPSVVLTNVVPKFRPQLSVRFQPMKDFGNKNVTVSFLQDEKPLHSRSQQLNMVKDKNQELTFTLDSIANGKKVKSISASLRVEDSLKPQFSNYMRLINYDHIPTMHYMYQSKVTVINEEVKTAGKRIGYIRGAGDNVPEALLAMGYEVVILEEQDIQSETLASFDAVITGVRAYNVNAYLTEKYDVLMEYIRNGGNLVVQYNTNSFIGPLMSRISPIPFTISRTRITNENSPVRFALPTHPVLNYPNKITKADFEGWVQERGIYFADKPEARFQAPLMMNDPGESEQAGSLIIADYGKGKFVYTGIVFFRQLPAGVSGAYRLLANIIALNKR